MCRLLCGEYGVYNKYADLDSRCRYIKAVRTTLKVNEYPRHIVGLQYQFLPFHRAAISCQSARLYEKRDRLSSINQVFYFILKILHLRTQQGIMEFFAEKRREVMIHIEKFMLESMNEYLKPIETIWQPSDFLPDSSRDTFFTEIKELQESAQGLSYDLVAVLIGDTITEEALPSYESWLAMVQHVSDDEEGGWMKWNRHWTAEENRHGDLLNKYLYLIWPCEYADDGSIHPIPYRRWV